MKATDIIRNGKVVRIPIEEHLKESPEFPKQERFYCCVCKDNTDGLSTCHLCGHMKGRWKTDKHHCKPSQEFIKEKRDEMNREATKEFHKLLARSKDLGFH